MDSSFVCFEIIEEKEGGLRERGGETNPKIWNSISLTPHYRKL